MNARSYASWFSLRTSAQNDSSEDYCKCWDSIPGELASIRKQELDQALEDAGLVVRQAHEGIATPVPTRSIETWLFALLNEFGLDEATDYKNRFEQEHRAHEMSVLCEAATAWKDIDETSLPSLFDGQAEMKRIDP